MTFVGTSLALSSNGVASVTSMLGIGTAEIWAVISVETRGAGFLPDRRPQILFERHVFSRLTSGQFDASNPDISSPTPGGYGSGGAHQYDRLNQAIALDNDAALQSASWGIGQVMGMNYQAAGFMDIETMVSAMTAGEDAQMSAMADFMLSEGLNVSLGSHDWASFARKYNGQNYAASGYDTKLDTYYQKYLVTATPNLDVRAAQIYLGFRGFNPGGVDGVLGSKTASEIRAFQASIGLPPTGVLDSATMSALLPA